MPRQGSHDYAFEVSIAFIHGRLDHELECYAKSLGCTHEELTSRLGALLSASGQGNQHPMSTLLQDTTGPARDEIRLSALALVGSTRGEPLRASHYLAQPEEVHRDGRDTNIAESTHRIAKSTGKPDKRTLRAHVSKLSQTRKAWWAQFTDEERKLVSKAIRNSKPIPKHILAAAEARKHRTPKQRAAKRSPAGKTLRSKSELSKSAVGRAWAKKSKAERDAIVARRAAGIKKAFALKRAAVARPELVAQTA